ncbi:DegV family protein [Pseudalkalibacillus caeni]|uniref:DegV family protein n=1 Tax=Exobacillus caeni TaxID=2574798 RepID=A0A5R9F4R2_9BACL|nr:DegV family protein [Pseudalkalibacillus caeni]TLS38507.1 DegV family protein [Pseudalkalibacillus caeni]
MKKVAIVTDSTAYIPEEIRKDLEITMVPLNVIFGNESYEEEAEITASDFYEKVKRDNELPKTSQPSIGYFVDTYEKLSKNHDAIITITLSSGISGTYQSAISAGQMVEGAEVYVFDSEISCMVQGFYVIEAARMALEGKDANSIMNRLEEIKSSEPEAYFMVDDLSHLHRGGRLNAAQLVVGNLLQIKPVLTFKDKVIVPFEKIRTRKKAFNRILQLFDQDAVKGKKIKATVIHANQPEEAEKLKEEITSKYPNVDVSVSYFGPVIATHLGEGALGLGWYHV